MSLYFQSLYFHRSQVFCLQQAAIVHYMGLQYVLSLRLDLGDFPCLNFPELMMVSIILFILFQFLVLDEADRVLDVGFEEELRVVFQCLPKNRQTLLFSATMTSDLQTLLELSSNKAYFYEAYEGFKTVESLKQQYIFVPKNVKDVYLLHILSKMEEMGIRSAIIFVSTCRYLSKTVFRLVYYFYFAFFVVIFFPILCPRCCCSWHDKPKCHKS